MNGSPGNLVSSKYAFWFAKCQLLSATLLVALLWVSQCRAASVAIIQATTAPSPQTNQIKAAAEFYGLNARFITVDSAHRGDALSAARATDTLAVAIDANALPFVSQAKLLDALHRSSGADIPLLIFGIGPSVDTRLLSKWSGGTVVAANPLHDSGSLVWQVGQIAGVTLELSGHTMPFPGYKAVGFILGSSIPTQTILTLGNREAAEPVFIKTKAGRNALFLLGNFIAPVAGEDSINEFAALAPMMIYVRYAAGSYAWHFPGHYANLTIDDPWLREPYGHLNYRLLLAEMEKHNFHTTIAFIPWNYDRSEAHVVAMFREHPDRFSVCIHGDNHDHAEFTSFQNRPLNVQEERLAQALARMDAFTRATGIPYDRVVVFPHNIGEERLFNQMKADNILATVNRGNVPIGAATPKGTGFELRPVTVNFRDFPSLDRFPARMAEPSLYVAVNSFLGNPLLFYDHESLFDSGVGAFDQVADLVNSKEPDTQWRSLGNIVEHLYLLRLRGESSYDVLAFSSTLQLENSSEQPMTFHIVKPEPDRSLIRSVTSNGQALSFTFVNDSLTSIVVVPAGQTRTVAITYRNDLHLATIPVRNASLRVYLLRTVSDFRDNQLSRTRIGRAVIGFYYDHSETPGRFVVLLAIVAMLFSIAVWLIVARLRYRRPAHALQMH